MSPYYVPFTCWPVTRLGYRRHQSGPLSSVYRSRKLSCLLFGRPFRMYTLVLRLCGIGLSML